MSKPKKYHRATASKFRAAAGPTAGSEPILDALVTKLCHRYNDSVTSVLVYGSCLRSGDIYDGLLDLYLIVSDYQSAYGGGLNALSNWLLPPNVFYEQVELDDKTLRCKYAVVSIQAFEKNNRPTTFESYFWGRFTQPTCIAWTRDEHALAMTETGLMSAAATFLKRITPAVPRAGSVQNLWQQGLALSYNTELRAERAGRAEELAQASIDYFEMITRITAENHPGLTLETRDGVLCYQSECSPGERFSAKVSWPLRTISGKLKSILRLTKALFTFAGGLDYIAWKLERHSGQTIEIPERVRRRPLIFAWGFFWSLYRQGIFK